MQYLKLDRLKHTHKQIPLNAELLCITNNSDVGCPLYNWLHGSYIFADDGNRFVFK